MIAVLTEAEAKKIVAKNVVSRLDELGHSRYWLAKQTGEHQSTIGNVCHGKKCCSAALLARIAEAIGLTPNDLLDRKTSRNSKKPAKST
jgi:hypothetical protein